MRKKENLLLLTFYYAQGIVVGIFLMCFSNFLTANNFQVKKLLEFAMGVINKTLLAFEFLTN